MGKRKGQKNKKASSIVVEEEQNTPTQELSLQKENSQPSNTTTSGEKKGKLPIVDDKAVVFTTEEKAKKEFEKKVAELPIFEAISKEASEYAVQNFEFTSRTKKDVLDISNEDFSKHFVNSIDGKQIVNPSTFNIFRDSLKKTSDLMHQKLLESLPDIPQSDSEEEESSSDGEVIPLDFRTASLNAGNDIIIQVKPLHCRKEDEIAKDDAQVGKDLDKVLDDEYLEALKLNSFAIDDEMVQHLDPGLDIEKIFGGIQLPCEKVRRINNQLDAEEI